MQNPNAFPVHSKNFRQSLVAIRRFIESGSTDFSFTGQRQDNVAGLYDFPAREYSSQGRCLSPDPAGRKAVSLSNPQIWNRYAYVTNQPLSLTDPTGMCPNWGPFVAGGKVICTAARTGVSGPDGSCTVDGSAVDCSLTFSLLEERCRSSMSEQYMFWDKRLRIDREVRRDRI